MANEFNKDEWMKSLNLTTDEEKKAAELLLGNPERVKEIQRGWNSVSEGSRLASEAQKAKQDADAARLAAEEMVKTNQAYFQSLQKYEDESIADREKREAYEKYLNDMGITPEVALAGTTPPPARKEAPVVDTKLADEHKQFRDQVTATAGMLADLPFELQAISNRHFELYGKVPPPDVMRGLKEKFLNAQNTKPLAEIAAAELHFADREKEMFEADLEKRTNDLVQEKIQKWESEHKLPTGALAAAEVEPAVNMTSEKFATDVKRSSDADVGNVSESALAAFQQAEAELAQAGIRMTG